MSNFTKNKKDHYVFYYFLECQPQKTFKINILDAASKAEAEAKGFQRLIEKGINKENICRTNCAKVHYGHSGHIKAAENHNLGFRPSVAKEPWEC